VAHQTGVNAMRPVFYETYQELFDAYIFEAMTRGTRGVVEPLRFDRDSARRVLSVRDAVEQGIGRAQVARRLRPDARYFLLVNFDEMVARPLTRAPVQSRDIATDPELVEFIADDVQTILQAAQKQVTPPADQLTAEIGGGQVVKALGQVYDQLKTVKLDVWG
jgi:hypothetical protein